MSGQGHPGEQPAPSVYGGPPPTGAQTPPQYPAYLEPYPYPYGYPQVPAGGYGPPPGYPPYPYTVVRGPLRPGTATAAAVLAFVDSGLLILAGALLFFGGSIASDLEDTYGGGTHWGTELTLDGFANLLAAGLLIAGAVGLLGRRSSGRSMMAVGSLLVLVSTIYWLLRFPHLPASGFLVWSIIFASLTVIALGLMFGSSVNAWLRGEQPARPY